MGCTEKWSGDVEQLNRTEMDATVRKRTKETHLSQMAVKKIKNLGAVDGMFLVGFLKVRKESRGVEDPCSTTIKLLLLARLAGKLSTRISDLQKGNRNSVGKSGEEPAV